MIVGLSGGVDSTALLVLAAVVAERESNLTGLHAVYVHHHLRTEADEDVVHCSNLCSALGVGFSVLHVHPVAAKHGLAAEARRLRHRALAGYAQQVGAKWILLAHQSDDVLETLIMRIGRGVFVRGLSAIPWRRKVSAQSDIALARPLLSVTRDELVQLCKAVGVAWREDASNANVKSARGFLRANLIDSLRSRWPRIASHAVDACDAARSGAWALSQIAVRDGWCAREIPRRQIRARGAVLASALLVSACRKRAIELSPRTIRAAVDAACGEEVHPRTFTDANATITVNARVLRMSATRSKQV